MRYLLLLPLLLVACTAQKHQAETPAPTAPAVAPRYHLPEAWAAHPHKKDPSDSVPQPLRREKRDTLVDVFFIHPTTYTDKGGSGNAPVADAALNQKTDGSTILFQASAFNQHARVFAPRYRQAHLSSFYIDTAVAKPLFDTAYADVRAAFLHYLEQYNNKRPIVIAAHSQGALMSIRLLQEFFDGKPLQQQLVAAYIVGWPVLGNTFTQLPVCSTPGQTGCFATWRTFKEGFTPPYVQLEQPRSFVTNPLTWRTDTLSASYTLNKGAVLRNFNKVVPQVANARVHGGVLWVTKLRFPGAFLLNTNNYHIGDINLYYVNIRRNVEDRINAYLSGAGGQP